MYLTKDPWTNLRVKDRQHNKRKKSRSNTSLTILYLVVNSQARPLLCPFSVNVVVSLLFHIALFLFSLNWASASSIAYYPTIAFCGVVVLVLATHLKVSNQSFCRAQPHYAVARYAASSYGASFVAKVDDPSCETPPAEHVAFFASYDRNLHDLRAIMKDS